MVHIVFAHHLKDRLMEAVTQKDRATTEARLLAAAETTFAEQGFAGTGVREIAGRAGVSVSLINRYFGGKDGLLMALAERLIAAKREGTLSYPPQTSLRDEIACYLRHRLDHDMENAALVRLLVSQVAIDKSFHQRVLPNMDGRADRNFRDRIEALKSDGKASPDLDVDMFFSFIENYSFTLNFFMGILGGRPRQELSVMFEAFADILARNAPA